MKYLTAAILSLLCFPFAAQDVTDSLALRSIYTYHLTKSASYENLRDLCKNVGARLSGSVQAEKAVHWAKDAMVRAGADTVYLVPCMVPKWVRGPKEQCMVATAKKEKLNVCALGGSVGTGRTGITAKVVEVTSFEELEKLGAGNIKGKIVFYNVYFDPTVIGTGAAYGKAVQYRWSGPSRAAKLGAVATLVRSMTFATDDVPHTGAMRYDSLVKEQIPAFALGPQSATKLSKLLAKDKNVKLYLYSGCETQPDVPSFSVVGELRGSEVPGEVIVVGGHLDSWDVGEGAHDDGAGIVQSIEVLAALKAAGIKNKRTIRAVAFMNEENGLRGGTSYEAYAEKENKKHIAAIESDGGGLVPRSLGIEAKADTFAYYKRWEKLFEPYMVAITQGGGGADIGPLEKIAATQMSLNVDSQRYFDFHHTSKDLFENVNKRELELGAAAMTSLVYLLDRYGTYHK